MNSSFTTHTEPITSAFQDFFFIIIFISMANIVRKINNYLDMIYKLEDSHKALEYRTEGLQKHYIRIDNSIDVQQESHKELKGDVRGLQKYHEQVIVSLHNLKQDLKHLNRIIDEEFSSMKEKIDMLNKEFTEIKNNQETLKNITYSKLEEYEEENKSLNHRLTIIYRDMKDDVNRISKLNEI